MRKVLFLSALIMPLLLGSCSKGSDDVDSPANPEPPKKPTATLTLSDEVIGTHQVIELKVDYQTDNPNILISWFCDDEKLNSIPKSDKTYNWNAGRMIGNHTLKVTITDRDNIVTAEKTIEVVKSEFGNAIIGDPKSKIARTCGVSPDAMLIQNVISSNEKFTYTFENDQLHQIDYFKTYLITPKTKDEYMRPVIFFEGMYESYKEKYGEPIRDNYSSLDKSESKKVEYGGHIYSGGMYLEAVFQTENRTIMIDVGPARSGYGFTYSEVWQKRY